jgi:osomolarity two-component system, sensor histidine kinase SLN1
MPVKRPQTPTAIDMADPERLPMPVVSSGSHSRSSRSRLRESAGKKSTRIDEGGGKRIGLHVHWARFKRHLGTGTAPSSSSAVGDESTGAGSSFHLSRPGGKDDDEKGEVDEVVVERDWAHEIQSSIVSPSERGAQDAPANTGGTQTDHTSTIFTHGITPWIILRYRVWPAAVDFFSPRFFDEKSENHYRKEAWFMGKVRQSPS